MKKIIFIFCLLIINILLNADSLNKYNLLLEDLYNYNTIAYKSKGEENKIDKFIQGKLIKTNDLLTFAIHGNGYIEIINNNKKYYTRSCFFKINECGQLETSNGMIFLSDVIINTDKLEGIIFSTNNKILINYVDKKNEEYLINLFIPNKNSKNEVYNNYYSFSDVEKIKTSKIYQGFIEASNVNFNETILKMENILFELSNSNKMAFAEYDYKIKILSQLLIIFNTNINNFELKDKIILSYSEEKYYINYFKLNDIFDIIDLYL